MKSVLKIEAKFLRVIADDQLEPIVRQMWELRQAFSQKFIQTEL